MRREQSAERKVDGLEWLLRAPVLWGLTILAALSVADAVRNAMRRSLDLQWSPARLLVRHVDAWAVYLAGDPGHSILRNQVPNYLHELYLLMLPLGAMPLGTAKLLWAAVNLLLVLASCRWVARLYELDRRRTWLLTVLVLTGTPFRVAVGNGQMTALVLAALAAWTVVESAGGRGLLLGVAWTKYSIPPVLGVYLLLRGRWRLLMSSVLPPFAGLLFFYVWLRRPFWVLAAEPFRCSADNVSPGLANAMAVSGILLRRPAWFRAAPDSLYLAGGGWAWAPYLAGIVLALGIATALWASGKSQGSEARPFGRLRAGHGATRISGVDGRIALACLTAACLVCFKHQIYDFLLLIFLLAAALRAPASRARNGVLLGIGYFWYAERLLHIRRWEFWPAVVVASFFLLLALIALGLELRGSVRWANRWEL